MYFSVSALQGKGASSAFGKEIIQVLLMFAHGQVGHPLVWVGTSGALSNDLFLREFELSFHPYLIFEWRCFPASSSTFLSQSYRDTQTRSPFLNPSSQPPGAFPAFLRAAEIIIALPLFCLRRLASLHHTGSA